jgi:hypothetical protein
VKAVCPTSTRRGELVEDRGGRSRLAGNARDHTLAEVSMSSSTSSGKSAGARRRHRRGLEHADAEREIGRAVVHER